MDNLSDQFLTFVLDEEIFGIEIESVKEILELPKITRIPQTSEDMLGVINLREHAVPVFDLRTRFQLPFKQDTVDTSIIIMIMEHENTSITFGIKVDSVREVLEIEQDSMEPVPASGMSVDNRFIKQIGKHQNEFIIILDGKKIVDIEKLELQPTG
jgi:purine-binding chemotaxis protein CheW